MQILHMGIRKMQILTRPMGRRKIKYFQNCKLYRLTPKIFSILIKLINVKSGQKLRREVIKVCCALQEQRVPSDTTMADRLSQRTVRRGRGQPVKYDLPMSCSGWSANFFHQSSIRPRSSPGSHIMSQSSSLQVECCDLSGLMARSLSIPSS